MSEPEASPAYRPPPSMMVAVLVIAVLFWASGAWVLNLSRPAATATGTPTATAASTPTATPTSMDATATATPSPTDPTPELAPVWTGPAAEVGGYTVMSYNITDASRTPDYAGMAAHAGDFAWPTRGPVVASWIAKVAPDLLGLQEANPVRGGGEQVDLLRDELRGYTWVYPLRNTTLAFRSSKFSLLDSGVIRVSRKGRDGSHYNRYAPWVKLRTTSGKRLLFVNLHAEFGQTKAKAKARSAGWDRLIDGLAKINPDGRLPVIITGDFNAASTETRPVFRDHLVKLKAADLVSAAQRATHRPVRVAGVTSFNGFGAVIGGEWRYRSIRRDAASSSFDYIWLGGGAKALAWQVYLGPRVSWRVTDGRVVPYADFIPSDHWPVLAKVKLK